MRTSQELKLDTHPVFRTSSPRREMEPVEFAELQIRYSKLEQQNRQNEFLAEKAHEYELLLDRSEGEIERLNELLQEKSTEVEYWRDKTGRFEAHLQQIKNMKENCYGSISQSQVRHVEEEKERVEDELAFKNKQIDEWKAKFSSLQRVISNCRVLQNEKKGLEDQLSYQTRICDDYERRLRVLQDADSHISELENELQNQESRRLQFLDQIQRLNKAMEAKSVECENYKKKLLHLENEVRGLRDVERELCEEKRRSQFIQEQLAKIKQLIADKSVEISKVKNEYGKRGCRGSEQMQKALEVHTKEIGQLYEKLDQANRRNDETELALMASNSSISNLQREIEIINAEKDSVISLHEAKAQQCENMKKQSLGRLEEIKQLRKSEGACFQYEVKLKNLEQNYKNIEQRYKKQTYRSEELNRAASSMRAELEKIKREGFYSESFVNEIIMLKKNYEGQEKENRQLQGKLNMMDKMIQIFKRELAKYVELAKINQKKWELVTGNITEFSAFTKKSLEMHNQMGKISEENINLESSKRLMTLELTQSNMLSKSLILDLPSTEYSNSGSIKKAITRSRFVEKPSSYVKYAGLRKSAIEPIRPENNPSSSEKNRSVQLIDLVGKIIQQ